MSVFLQCSEAHHVCDKNQYKEASFWEKVKLNIHLVFCSFCRKYSARNMRLTKAIKNSNITTMPPDQKEALEQRLQKELANY